MSKYEEYIGELESTIVPSDDALEAATEALAFVENLNALLRENGAELPEEPNVDKIGTVLDGVFGELAAASIFLSEKAFSRVPEMLRVIAKQFESEDVDFTDPDGHTGPSVPSVVVSGFTQLADRIEHSRRQRAQLMGELQKFLDSEERA